MNTCDVCETPLEHRRSTFERPYMYTESGLPNIGLIDVDVYSCAKCEMEVADIPNSYGLHALLARDLLFRPIALSGEEFRFLRKETGLRPREFAERLGVDPKTIQNWENLAVLNRANDLFARLIIAECLKERHSGMVSPEFFAIPPELIGDNWTVNDDGIEKEIEELARVNTRLGITNSVWGFASPEGF